MQEAAIFPLMNKDVFNIWRRVRDTCATRLSTARLSRDAAFSPLTRGGKCTENHKETKIIGRLLRNN